MAKPLVISLELDGRTYDLTPDDFTGADDLAIFREVGATLMDVFARKHITLFTLAALIWRYRVNHGEPNITFESVNEKMTFSALSTVSDEPAEGDHSGEA